MPLPDQWKNADLTDPAVRAIFADWLEERGDWRAEEIRRMWVGQDVVGRTNKTVYIIHDGPHEVGTRHHISLHNAELVIAHKIFDLFHRFIDGDTWQKHKEVNHKKVYGV